MIRVSLVLTILIGVAAASAQPARTRVVIDPGHGGQAAGATGLYGVAEKDVTLAIALKLGKLLEQRPDLSVSYTRTEDTDVSLKERAEKANALDADLFVSIHCNASPAPGAHGIETFFLGRGGDDAQADELALRENGTEAPPLDEDPAVGRILADLRRNGNLTESAPLAEAVQKRLTAAFPETVSRAVCQARFAVLRRARMPSVVVEVGFLTHAKEGLDLVTPSYQDRLARALRDGIVGYLEADRSQGR